MKLKLDHLLHAVRDPEQTRNEFARVLGWRTLAGGEHLAFGTYNALSYFGLSYIEWIGVRSSTLAATSELGQRVVQALEVQEGAFQCALRTQEMDRIVADWRERELPFHGPVAASRTLPDGRILRWKMLFPAQGEPGDYLLPFVIAWEEEDSVRLDDLVRRGALPAQRATGVLPIAIHTPVRSSDVLRERFERYYSLPRVSMTHDEWGHGVGYSVGDTNLWFWESKQGEVLSLLCSAGERPFQLDMEEQGVNSPDQEKMVPLEQRECLFEFALSSLSLYGLRVALNAQGGYRHAE